MKRDLRVSSNNSQSFFLLSFCVVYAVHQHGVFYTLTEQIFCFAALSLTYNLEVMKLACYMHIEKLVTVVHVSANAF